MLINHLLVVICYLIVGKKRRLTFIECGNDLNSMIDVAKVADLVSYCIALKILGLYNYSY